MTPTPTERIQIPHTCAVDNDCAACKAICAAHEASDRRQVVVLRKENASLRAELAEARAERDGMKAVVVAACAWREKAAPSSPRYDNAWWRLYDAVEAYLRSK